MHFRAFAATLLAVAVQTVPSLADEPRQHHFTFYTGNIPPWVFTTPGYYPQYQVGNWYPGYGYGGPGWTYQWMPTQSPFPGGVDYKLVPVPYGAPYAAPYPYQSAYPSTLGPVWPSTAVPNAASNPVLRDTLRENAERWEQPLAEQPIAPNANKNLKPTTPERQVEAAKHQARGDAMLQDQQYRQAYQQFREALKADPNRAEAEFHLGFALVGLGRFDDAVAAFKRGIALDPAYPNRGVTLEDVYGDTQQLAISSFEHEVAAWVREDIRDPDRLFLMGVLLHFDHNQTSDRSDPFFEAAYRLAGKGAHLQAFLAAAAPQERRALQRPRQAPRVESLTEKPGSAPPPLDEDQNAPPRPSENNEPDSVNGAASGPPPL